MRYRPNIFRLQCANMHTRVCLQAHALAKCARASGVSGLATPGVKAAGTYLSLSSHRWALSRCRCATHSCTVHTLRASPSLRPLTHPWGRGRRLCGLLGGMWTVSQNERGEDEQVQIYFGGRWRRWSWRNGKWIEMENESTDQTRNEGVVGWGGWGQREKNPFRAWVAASWLLCSQCFRMSGCIASFRWQLLRVQLVCGDLAKWPLLSERRAHGQSYANGFLT